MASVWVRVASSSTTVLVCTLDPTRAFAFPESTVSVEPTHIHEQPWTEKEEDALALEHAFS